MREEEFRDWLEAGPRTPGTVSTQLSKVRKIEKNFGDLDDLIKSGEIERVAKALSVPEHAPDHLGAVKERSHLRQSLRYYRQFASESRTSFDLDGLNRLKGCFLAAHPDFEPGGGFTGQSSYHEEEDAYKRALIERSHSIVAELGDRPEEIGAALLDLIGNETDLDSNLMGWRMATSLRERRAAHPGVLELAAGQIALANDIAGAVLRFVADTWDTVFADTANNPYSDSRLIPTLIAALTHPNEAIALRTDRFNIISESLIGERLFGWNPLNEAELTKAMLISEKLFHIMRDEWDWKPRDLWDAQGFIWVTCGEALGDGDNMTNEELLHLFDSCEYFRTRRVKWSDEQREAFCNMARMMHDVGLDWYRTNIPQVRVGRKENGAAQASATLASFDAAPARIRFTHSAGEIGIIGERFDCNSEGEAALASILDAKRDQILQWRAPVPEREGLWPGYDAADEVEELDGMTDVSAGPTNLILYGPPGTGKTYRTALEAVRLCDGNVEYTNGIEGRAALMRRYHELVDKRQIDFVTFHQNFSYEDFVEGLRPVPITNSDGESTGFHLQVESGIFRRISERAETDGFDTDGSLTNISDRAVYKMSLGEVANPAFDFVFDESISNGYALFGFRDIDWTDQKFEDRDEILNAAAERFPNEEITSNKGIVQSPDVFRNQLQIGDVLVIAKGNHKFRAIGIVEGEYEYAPRPDGAYCHRRRVSWLWSNKDGLDVGELYPPKFIQKTIYRLKDAELNRPLLARLIASADGVKFGERIRQYVLIIDEINRANISKVFGELITLIEPDKRIGMQNAIKVRLPYSKKDFSVPTNLHIVGTMNTADRSIALLDTALRRRFRFEELAPDPDLLNAVDGIDLSGVLRTINARVEYLLDRDHAIGHAFFMGEGAASRSAIDDTMRFKVIPLLQEYFFEDWSRIHAVLGDGFVAGTKLAPPPDLDERYAVEERKTWSVRTPFAADAYSTLLGKAKPANEIEVPGPIQ